MRVKTVCRGQDGPKGRGRVKGVWLFTFLSFAACAGLVFSVRAEGQSTPPSHAKIELIADDAPPSSGTVWVGLLFHMDPGWHIYWQNPGDSGTPPRVEWQLPAWYRAGAIRWPTPIRLAHNSIVDYAYEDEVLLMAPIERSSNSRGEMAIAIAADVRYIVCSDVCIPEREHLTLTLPSRSSETDDAEGDPAQWHSIFQRTRLRIPRPAPSKWGLSVESSKDEFVLSVHTGVPAKSATFFPLNPNEVENSAPQAFTSTEDGLRLTLRKSEQLAKPVATLRGLVVLGPESAFEVAVPVVGR